MIGNYRIDISFESEMGRKQSCTEFVYCADSAQEAVDIIRETRDDLKNLRIDNVWREEEDHRWHIRTNWD